jgi:hypothetical protein
VLPQSAWFFFASPENHLALHGSHPASGLLAATFRSARIPAPVLAIGMPAAPLLYWPFTARLLRWLGSRVVAEYAKPLAIDPLRWHAYSLDWRSDVVRFTVDGTVVGETTTVPEAPLGLVLWIDNQYAAFPPDGRVSFGRLKSAEPSWLEIDSLSVHRGRGGKVGR